MIMHENQKEWGEDSVPWRGEERRRKKGRESGSRREGHSGAATAKWRPKDAARGGQKKPQEAAGGRKTTKARWVGVLSPTKNKLAQGHPRRDQVHVCLCISVMVSSGSPCTVDGTTTIEKCGKREIVGKKEGERKRRLRTTSKICLGLGGTCDITLMQHVALG